MSVVKEGTITCDFAIEQLDLTHRLNMDVRCERTQTFSSLFGAIHELCMHKKEGGHQNLCKTRLG